MLSTFDADPRELRNAAHLADGLGITALWTMDHLSGQVHADRRWVIECFTVLTLLAEATERASIGPMVLNPIARHPVVLAQALATVQELTGGRLRVGVGAGGGIGNYGAELEWAGLVNSDSSTSDNSTSANPTDTDPARPVLNHSAAERRGRVVELLSILEHLWSGSDAPWTGSLYSLAGSSGFLVPAVRPPVIVAGYGPRMARLAGEYADGFNTIATADNLESLASSAREAHTHRAGSLLMSTYAVFEPSWLDPDSAGRRRLADVGVDALVLVLPAPFDDGLIREIAAAR